MRSYCEHLCAIVMNIRYPSPLSDRSVLICIKGTNKQLKTLFPFPVLSTTCRNRHELEMLLLHGRSPKEGVSPKVKILCKGTGSINTFTSRFIWLRHTELSPRSPRSPWGSWPPSPPSVSGSYARYTPNTARAVPALVTPNAISIVSWGRVYRCDGHALVFPGVLESRRPGEPFRSHGDEIWKDQILLAWFLHNIDNFPSKAVDQPHLRPKTGHDHDVCICASTTSRCRPLWLPRRFSMPPSWASALGFAWLAARYEAFYTTNMTRSHRSNLAIVLRSQENLAKQLTDSSFESIAEIE